MLQKIISIALAAGSLIREKPSDSLGPKADGSPVTAADLAADQLIRAELLRLDATIPCISEESVLPEFAQRRDWRRFWLVDPLDGTKEFQAGRSDFTVNIALIEAGVPVLGVIYAPRRDLLFFASREEGSWRKEGAAEATRIRSKKKNPGQPLRIVESRSHPSEKLEAFVRKMHVTERVQLGSSLKFCSVAEGSADVYPRFGPTMEWDVAAGDCIYRYSAEKGSHSSPLAYNKPDLRNGDFVIGLDDDA
jgi:3'(2'), 5'-bisphosphate nucleotidase